MKKKLIAFLLAAVMAIPLWSIPAFAEGETQSAPSTSAAPSLQYVQPKFSGTPAQILAQMRAQMMAAYQRNPDVVGYLYIPGTSICEPVVQTADNNFYLRRNWQGQDSHDGCYYLDYTCLTGTRDELSRNTVIYGHSMDENPNGSRFSQLKKFQYASFAKQSPYIYYCTLKEDMVWQIFSVYYIHTKYPYNLSDLEGADFLQMLTIERKRSRLLFDTKITTQDKIMTLSTCTYALDATYPNNHRFVVAARLMQPGEAMGPVNVQVNPSPLGPD